MNKRQTRLHRLNAQEKAYENLKNGRSRSQASRLIRESYPASDKQIRMLYLLTHRLEVFRPAWAELLRQKLRDGFVKTHVQVRHLRDTLESVLTRLENESKDEE